MHKFDIICITESILTQTPWIVRKSKKKISRPDFVDSEIVIWRLTSLANFYFPFIKKTTCVRLSKENIFSSNNAPEIHIVNSWRYQKLLLVANQLQDSTFFKKLTPVTLASVN